MEKIRNKQVLPDITELEALCRIAQQKSFNPQLCSRVRQSNNKVILGKSEFAGTQKYCPGDEIRFINWRTSARSNELQVQQQYLEQNNRWYICIDSSASMGLPDTNKWLLSIQVACAISYILLNTGNQLSIIFFDEKVNGFIPLGLGKRQFKKIYLSLQQHHPRSKGGDSLLHRCIPLLKTPSKTLIISDFLKPDMMKTDLKYLAAMKNQIHILHVMEQQEYLLTQTDLILSDIESGGTQHFNTTTENINRVRENFKQQPLELKSFCQKHGYHYSFSNTNQGWQDATIKLIRML